MRKVSVYYNPYLESTRLVIDGKERTAEGNRLDGIVVGKPLHDWLSPCVISYRKWEGFLPELIEDLNDDELEVTFYTIPEYFEEIKNELDRQSAIIEGKGYDADVWIFKGIAKFPPEPVIKRLNAFIETEGHFLPGPLSTQLMHAAEEKLSEKGSLSVIGLREAAADLKAVADTALEECEMAKASEKKRKHWEKAKRNLIRDLWG